MADNLIDPMEFQKSITSELKVIENRVRNLIGDANWSEEGRYKETALRNVLARFLPKNISVGSGFILNGNGFNDLKISNQIDIIVYDNNYPLLFNEGEFIVTTPQNVKGIVEVKTKFESGKISEAIAKSTENGRLINHNIFNGIFSYQNEGLSDPKKISNSIETALRKSQGVVNHLCAGENIFFKYWDEQPMNPLGKTHKVYNIYQIKNLSFAYFIQNLLENVLCDSLAERLWFSYPIKDEGGKEAFAVNQILTTSNDA